MDLLERIDLEAVFIIATVTTAIAMLLNTLLLIGFRRGRLRGFNCYYAGSVAMLAAARYGEYATGAGMTLWGAAAWANLGLGSLVGLWAMIRIARTDPPVFRLRRKP